MNVMKLPQMAQIKSFLLQYRYVVLMMVVGVVLLVFPSGGEKEVDAPEVQETGYDVAELELRLGESLSQVAGAGETSVVLTLADEGRTIVAQDVQKGDSVKSNVVTVTDENRGEQPIALQTIAPNFRGALIVSEGGGDPLVELRLIHAVSVLTGLGSDKIAVCASG